MVDIRLDCEKPNWEEKALRYLYGGARLIGLSEAKVEVLERLAAQYGLEIRKEPGEDEWCVSGEVVFQLTEPRSEGPRKAD